jgi:transcriptional regulator GlxA family with amidase domain
MRALQAAHRTLRSAEPGSVRVSEVATAHGFAHRGRFAGLYTAVYGETPSATLRCGAR